MPHPTPVQIAYGSAAVISSTFLLLLISPTGSLLTVSLIATSALILGVVVAVAVQSRRDNRRETAGARQQIPAQRRMAPTAVSSAAPGARTAERPGVRV
ncbi:hypothetical protein PJ985_18270 [Streptomyces sp. ACA25]|uniref:hypothetical protein n=1 Tax=Streptomyces sp. ACA25 TaxID=3022596 RepID=UPI0023075B65|nr:hypothetical protein [Streptomyces sp. ACA25]MDB1089509.1 hypothetical protein [Streptomyces sp. ACA25]